MAASGEAEPFSTVAPRAPPRPRAAFRSRPPLAPRANRVCAAAVRSDAVAAEGGGKNSGANANGHTPGATRSDLLYAGLARWPSAFRERAAGATQFLTDVAEPNASPQAKVAT